MVLSSGIKVAFIIYKAPLIAFAIISIFDTASIALGLIYFYKKNSRLKFLNWQFNLHIAKKLLSSSWPLALSGLVISLYMKIDQIMIKEMLNVEAVGQYAAAVRLSEAWYFLPIVIAKSLFPAIINAKETSESLYYKRLQHLYTLMIWLAIGIAFPITIWSDHLISVSFGKNYSEASSVLKLHAWSGVFVFLGVAFSRFLVTENLFINSCYRTSTGAFFNIVLNYFLISKYGIQGAAIATILSQMIANLLYDIFDKELSPI